MSFLLSFFFAFLITGERITSQSISQIPFAFPAPCHFFFFSHSLPLCFSLPTGNGAFRDNEGISFLRLIATFRPPVREKQCEVRCPKGASRNGETAKKSGEKWKLQDLRTERESATSHDRGREKCLTLSASVGTVREEIRGEDQGSRGCGQRLCCDY